MATAAQERAQELLRGAGGLPRGQRARGAKAGDEGGVEAVGLVALPEAARVILDAARVGDVDAPARGVQCGGGQLAVAAGGFEHGVRRGCAVPLAPRTQAGEAAHGVVELRVVGARAEEQAGVELGLGDVQAQADAEGFGEDHEWGC